MPMDCRYGPLYELLGWLRDLAILAVIVLAVVIIVLALVAAVTRGVLERRNHGSLAQSIRHNLTWTAAGLILCLGILPVLALLAWKMTWSMHDAGSDQRSASLAEWTLPLWQATPGSLGEALDRVLNDPRARKERHRNHLLDTLRQVLIAYDHELYRADRIALDSLPTRLRALESRRPHGWREIALAQIEGASAWQMHKPELGQAFGRCGEAGCGEGVIHAFTYWCDRLPLRCRRHIATPEGRKAIDRAEALGVSEHLVNRLRYRLRDAPT